ncbi:oxidoreductase [Ectobacillus ponti]|uniref:Oxidoreductase n=1 Tax=Ectobacillus ponti TaxID=2961894 RepID=A0AA41X557_9BACI|nr:oxidoreductase [Ectobacillus ponti]MCP8968887.1 oxidoreductase [Ectobacillus ponti]
MHTRTALVLGATGLVGQEVVRQLLDSPAYSSVAILTRRPLDWESPKLHQHIVQFDELEVYAAQFQVHDVYCCLGTTIKKAKTKEQFWKVDYEYTIQAAKLAAGQGVQNFLVISSMGASEKSLFFYSQVKGRMERELKQLPIRSIHVLRPSLLLGEREEFRFGEKLAEKVSAAFPFLYSGALRKYRPITAEQVAKAMCRLALADGKGIHVHESDELGGNDK